ncbi:MAG: ROK family protein, partial [Verrucomicrobiales bacterium]
MTVHPKCPPPLDPQFIPAALWNRSFRQAVQDSPSEGLPLGIALEQPDGSVSVYETALLPKGDPESKQLNFRYVERLVKFLLWQRGGFRVYLGGDPDLSNQIAGLYQADGERAFDTDFMGTKAYRQTFEIAVVETVGELPAANESVMSLGGHLDGCRIGFDLG